MCLRDKYDGIEAVTTVLQVARNRRMDFYIIYFYCIVYVIELTYFDFHYNNTLEN